MSLCYGKRRVPGVWRRDDWGVGQLVRRRADPRRDWRAGAGLPPWRLLRGRRGRSCRGQLVQESGPEAASRSLPLPAPLSADRSPRILYPRPQSLLPKMMNADMDAVDAENQVELEEKTRLINQVLELQHTLEDLSARVDAVKEENLKLKSENQVLGQYIENLMSASSVFQTTDTKSKRK
ncbi:PREDICTED: short coiled-coil protein [Condylura cristata]|uniref:short coiled-coil protein n=1 Tax=Condylura cristata TaxID=143302 RepID=UPI000643E228|nr:PREDICTED: short coiled-coil protein [Condylura cristata]